ncbi:glycine-rich domain-containing protein [Azospirillum largimobile]
MVGINIKDLKIKVMEAELSVNLIDLSLIKRKMVETFGWDPDVVDTMEDRYRKFLCVQSAAKASGVLLEIVPDRMIDEIWHMHILDTRKYATDCNVLFGEILHHDPYFGMMGEADRVAWSVQANQCDHLWYELFGVPLYSGVDGEDDAYALDREFHRTMSLALSQPEQAKVTRCRTQCKPVRCK